ncbi:MAG: AraC family transcriptional regulator [Clostridiales bacterium]|nr:AraC family transcriptional regulator [Clostridiales bacterium]
MKNHKAYTSLAQTWAYPPGTERRDYSLVETSPVVELNDMVWYPPYADDTLHYHNCMEIGICVEGDGTIVMGEGHEPLPFSAGTVVIMPAGLPHCQQNMGDPVTRWRYIALDEKRLLNEMPQNCREAVRSLLENTQKNGLYTENSDVAKEVEKLVSLMFDIKCRYADEIRGVGEIEALLILLLMRASRQPLVEELHSTADPLEMKVIEPALLYVSEHYRDDIKVRDLASSCAMSESHFRKVFGRLMGMSPLEYVNRYRVHRAMHLLHVTHSPIQRIAADCGFASIATFVRNFTHYAGQTPSLWRKNCRFWKEIN